MFFYPHAKFNRTVFEYRVSCCLFWRKASSILATLYHPVRFDTRSLIPTTRTVGDSFGKSRFLKPNTAKAIASFVIVILLSSAAHSETPLAVEWIRQFGTSSTDSGYSTAVDSDGSVYISGSTSGSLGGTNAGGLDAYLRKYDSAGNELWTRQFGTSSLDDTALSVAVDSFGGVYIGGYSSGSLGGTNRGEADAYLRKYDSAGNELWTRQFGTRTTDYTHSVAVDSFGGVYISGYSFGSLGGTNAGVTDAYLRKYDNAGNELWTRQFGTSSREDNWSVTVDSIGDVYTTGYTSGSLEGTNAGGADAYLRKYDSTGNELWTRQFGTSSNEYGRSVTVDAIGDVYITGNTFGGSLGGASAGGFDAYLRKYDSAGNELWTHQFGTNSTDESWSVAVDAVGGVYITGDTSGSLGGTNSGGTDAFLVKYDSAGNELWTHQFGTSVSDVSYSVAVDAVGSVFLSGYTSGSLEGINAGGRDAFLIKFSAVPEPCSIVLIAFGSILLPLHRRRGA